MEITVPTLGESVTEATVAKWFKAVGDAVAADEPLVELETDKVTLEVNAPGPGTLSEIAAAEGAEVEVGARLGTIAEGKGPAKKAAPAAEGYPTVRTLLDMSVRRCGPHRVSVSVEADGFLQHQVRRMVGALVEVGEGAGRYGCSEPGPARSVAGVIYGCRC